MSQKKQPFAASTHLDCGCSWADGYSLLEDLETELDPSLPEVTRHGTTGVIVGNCSIGLAFGNQRVLDCDPIVGVLRELRAYTKIGSRKTAEKAIWRTPRIFEPFLRCLLISRRFCIPVLRIERSWVWKRVLAGTQLNRAREDVLHTGREALESGYIGMSTDGLPLHYLANEPYVKKRILSMLNAEYKMLTDVLRDYDRVWQMTPSTDNQALATELFMLVVVFMENHSK